MNDDAKGRTTSGPGLFTPAGSLPERALEEAAATVTGEAEEERRARRRRRRRFVLGGLAVLALLLVGGPLYAVRHALDDFDRSVERFPSPFRALPEAGRPVVDPAARGAVNVLLLGTDGRIRPGDPARWPADARSTQSVMLVHVARDQGGATVVSVPQRSPVPIRGVGTAPLEQAFARGGPALLVETVERVTKVRIDHVAVIDLDGFRRITDALGGVRIRVGGEVRRMDGATALEHVRGARSGGGSGGGSGERARELERIGRQQAWVRGIVQQARSAGTLLDPLALRDALGALSTSLATDDGFTLDEMSSLAGALRGSGPGSLRFVTVPDPTRAGAVWTSLRTDRPGRS